ncbi:MAG: hypothetical protein ACRDSE_13260 [Pseudonocardiaceae bacterium]
MLRLDDDRQRAVYAADPCRLHSLDAPVLLDEWQRLPEVWGSAAPAGATIHWGTGRIVDLRMRPLSLAERDIVPPAVSLAALLTGERAPVSGTSPVTLDDYVDEILRSGSPASEGCRSGLIGSNSTPTSAPSSIGSSPSKV